MLTLLVLINAYLNYFEKCLLMLGHRCGQSCENSKPMRILISIRKFIDDKRAYFATIGHETTRNVLTYTLILVIQHPDVLAR